MEVMEMFNSIQGEGAHMGEYVTFLRLAGCTLRCDFCDTKASWSLSSFTELSIEELKEKLTALVTKTQAVVVTGGEPTLQWKELLDLVKQMDSGIMWYMETNGTATEDVYCKLQDYFYITVSPKSDANYANHCPNPEALKYVVDEAFMRWVKAGKMPVISPRKIWLQPCDGPDLEQSKQHIAKLVSEYPLLCRAGIQLHKYYEVR